MTIKEELLKIKGNKELLIPSEVIFWARFHPNSKLYAAIPWDDAYAANEYRLQVVRGLITLHITTEVGDPEIVSLSIDRPREGGGYRLIEDVLPVPQLREVMLEDAIRELRRVQAKYQHIRELAKVWEEVKKVEGRKNSKRRPSSRAGEVHP